jgi:pyrroline-5-carboxylate reductase
MQQKRQQQVISCKKKKKKKLVCSSKETICCNLVQRQGQQVLSVSIKPCKMSSTINSIESKQQQQQLLLMIRQLQIRSLKQLLAGNCWE